jgi:hypothetical protein
VVSRFPEGALGPSQCINTLKYLSARRAHRRVYRAPCTPRQMPGAHGPGSKMRDTFERAPHHCSRQSLACRHSLLGRRGYRAVANFIMLIDERS